MINKSAILSAAERLDAWIPSMPKRRPADTAQHLVILLVHTLYERSSDPDEATVFPHERMTVDKLRRFLNCFLESGFTFVSPADVVAGSLSKKAMMLTFDDGYFSFTKSLPVLQELDVPATLFVSPHYVAEQQSFWWDAIYRNARSRGGTEKNVRREISQLRKRSFDDVHRLIHDRWGERAMQWSSDIDRPLSLDELRDVARHPLVHLGNHTWHHAALPFRSEAEARSEIERADDFLRREMGQTATAISYPNGDYSTHVIDVSRQLGYSLGMTIEPSWNLVDQQNTGAGRRALSLGRYMLSGERDVVRQAHSVSTPFSVCGSIRRLKKHKFD